MSRFPFGIPKSWYVIGFSDELGVGDVHRLDYMGKELVAFRGKSGRVAVLDAHCPHLGAHLGVGGNRIAEPDRQCRQKWGTLRRRDRAGMP